MPLLLCRWGTRTRFSAMAGPPRCREPAYQMARPANCAPALTSARPWTMCAPLRHPRGTMARDLGTKYVCFKCGTEFYDLKKSLPVSTAAKPLPSAAARNRPFGPALPAPQIHHTTEAFTSTSLFARNPNEPFSAESWWTVPPDLLTDQTALFKSRK